MAIGFEETDQDRASWARLWSMVRTHWDRTEDLAKVLGVTRAAVGHWATGLNRGPWTLLRASIRETARRNPDAIPRLVEELVAELFDGAKGQWVPAREMTADLSWTEESADLAVLSGRLHAAVRDRDPTAVDRAAELAPQQMDELFAAARMAAARRAQSA